VKKAVSATLCSAFVIPGLGQILNQDIVKGLAFLASVFILLVTAAVKFFLMLTAAVEGPGGDGVVPGGVLERFLSSDFTLLWICAVLFAAIWLTSVADAFARGKRLDAMTRDESRGGP